jgi:hypothetical protein
MHNGRTHLYLAGVVVDSEKEEVILEKQEYDFHTMMLNTVNLSQEGTNKFAKCT